MASQVPVDYRFTSHGMAPAPTRLDKIDTYKGAYVSLTTRCNTDVCRYCYARDQKLHGDSMPLELFKRVLHMLAEVSDFPEVYLVGGEPTTLANLAEYLLLIHQRGWTTTVYTNGAFGRTQREVLMASPALTRIAFHLDRVLFSRFPRLEPVWHDNLASLSEHSETSIMMVIDALDTFSPEEPVDLAARYGSKLTWAFASPTSAGTPYLGLREMKQLGPSVQRMLLYARNRRVRCSPDLPVPLCVFDRPFLDTNAAEFTLVRRCKPFAYFHVDGAVSFCTSLPAFTAPSPSDAGDLRHIIARHRSIDLILKGRSSFPECATCPKDLLARCQGGCMTYKIYGDQRETHVEAIDRIRSAAARSEG